MVAEAFPRWKDSPTFPYPYELHASKERSPVEDLRGLRTTVRVAEEMGALLGRSPDVFRPLSPRAPQRPAGGARAE